MRRFRAFPDDERFWHLPWRWHLYGLISDRFMWLREGPFRRTWAWWVDLWLAAILEASEKRRVGTRWAA